MPTKQHKYGDDAIRVEGHADPAHDIERETRFAVVMYGGVSLAIYIYGVTKELFSMVKATARKRIEGKSTRQEEYLLDESHLTEIERVYRKIGEQLGTKFVVDILSGTSAGGINAVFLAKALVNGQHLDQLKNIWLEEGDIGKLINDKSSIIPGLELQNPPRSLLNNDRMYFHLLNALHGMDEKSTLFSSTDGISPFVEELDLNITATDIHGLPVTLPVSNTYVKEVKYRNVFRFHYSTMDAAGWETQKKDRHDNDLYSNDFHQNNNPFLAYAARCTSSFPVAFEPMQLEDIVNVLSLKEFERYSDLKLDTWKKFFKGYEKNTFTTRSFGDGGYIDNKPFSYATELLVRRTAEVPVDRKLIYIDPSPEHPDISPNKNGERPDALQNVLAATMSIPRYEPIREDLEKVIDRNRLIKRVNEVISHIDFVPGLREDLKPWQKDTTKWANKFFDKELLEWFGVSYATYHQLRVAGVLEDFQTAMLRAMNWDETGTQAEEFHVLVEGWRKYFYSIKPEAQDSKRSENDILFRLDTTWRMRRILFLQNLINKILKAIPTNGEWSSKNSRETEANQIFAQSGIKDEISTLDAVKAREELLSIKGRLNEAYGHLRARGRKVRSRNLIENSDLDTDLKQYVSVLYSIESQIRGGLDGLANEARRIAKTGDRPSPELLNVFQDIEDASIALSAHLAEKDEKREKGYIHKSLSYAGEKVKGALGYRAGSKQSIIQQCLSYYHDRFEYYDMLIFPIYYGTDVGESDETEIIRINPEDANNLVDEKTGKRKLAGTTLMNFGAFFAKDWRENDMMWGRLDAAECVIKAMMPDNAQRASLIDEVQSAILKEELPSFDDAKDLKEDELDNAANKNDALLGVNNTPDEELTHERVGQPGELLSLFKEKYSVNKNFPPQETLSASSRALRVFSQLLDGLSDNHKQFSTPAKWLTFVSSVFAGILAVVLPNSVGNFMAAGYWVWLLYIFELLLFGVGWLMGATGIAQLGIVLFALTFISHLLLREVNHALSGKPASLRFVALVVAGILGIGTFALLLFLVYMGLLALGWWSLPDGTVGAWLNGLTKGK